MRRLLGIALFLVSVIGVFHGQQSTPAAPPQPAEAKPESVKVYSPGPDVTAPELIHEEMPIKTDGCKKELKGEVTLSVIVDAQGQLHDVSILQPSRPDLNNLAIQSVHDDRFKPGSYEKKPVAVGLSLTVGMEGCVAEIIDEHGKESTFLVLKAQSDQKFSNLQEPITKAIFASDGTVEMYSTNAFQGIFHVTDGKISAPAPLNSVAVKFPDKARREKIQGTCWVTLIVDKQGQPQDIRILKSLDPGLDQNAIEAVSNYRFKPAMKDGVPVPVMIAVEINFKLY